VTWLEDTSTYSSDLDRDWRVHRATYVSAEDAVDQYLRLRSEMQGMPAIDYERAIAVDSSPTPQNPASLKAHEAFFLERIFHRVRGEVGRHRWRVWGLVRVHRYTLREAAREEQLHRREEIQYLHSRDGLRAWCDRYGVPFPADAQDPFQYRRDHTGISPESPQTAKRYRDNVDARLEEELVSEGSLIRDAVREDEDVRELEGQAV